MYTTQKVEFKRPRVGPRLLTQTQMLDPLRPEMNPTKALAASNALKRGKRCPVFPASR